MNRPFSILFVVSVRNWLRHSKEDESYGLREASREPKESLENKYLLELEYWNLQQSKFSSMDFF